MDFQSTADALRRLATNIEGVITGKRAAVDLAAAALIADQHVLIEDVPGVGKTMLARALARSLDGTFLRIQGTPDLLPQDITGSSVYDPASRSFTFLPGPVFANVVLVDEINRATPKAQSALLQVMEERSVAVDGLERHVPTPFIVLATRNPIEHHGTYPLPEGELDRFGVSLTLGYPDVASERSIVIRQRDHHPIEDLQPVLTCDEIEGHRVVARHVHIADDILDYILALTRATRSREGVRLGASPRASIALSRVSQAMALLASRDFVTPADVKAAAPSVLSHRLVLDNGRADTDRGAAVVDAILRETPAPVA